MLEDKQKATSVVPDFPYFTKLDLSHKELLQEISNNFPAYSDFNFVSLFTWDTDGSAEVSMLNNNLVIKFVDYIDNSRFFSFIGLNKIDETIEALFEHAKKSGESAELLLIPHSVASKASSKKFEIVEDRDNHDYILSVEDLVAFKSNQYRGKKNLLNRFSKQYGDKTEYHELDLSNPKIKKQLEQLLTDWQKSRNKKDRETVNEFIAIRRSLKHSENLGIKAFGGYYDNRLIAFTIFEILPDKVAVIHFDKADVRYIGVFEHLKHNFAKHLAKLDIKEINYEQDLGLEGLRRAKESYHPIRYLKKYKIRSRQP